MLICFHLFLWVVFFFNQVPRSLCMPHGLLVLALSHPWDTTTMARNLMERNPHLPLLGLAGSWQPCESNNEKVRQWKRRHTQPKVTAKLLHRFQQLHWGFKSLKASVSSYTWFLPCTPWGLESPRLLTHGREQMTVLSGAGLGLRRVSSQFLIFHFQQS